MPATYVGTPGCEGCLELTVTLRPDASYLARERVGGTDFHDFGRWRLADGVLELTGESAVRRHPLRGLKLAPQAEPLSGPFRMVGVYDGRLFKECLTGVAWPLADTRSADSLRQRLGGRSALVALDVRIEGAPEALRLTRPARPLNAPTCPG